MKRDLKAAALFLSVLAWPGLAAAATPQAGQAGAYTTAFDYVVTFYPRWLSYYQAEIAPRNHLVGPERIGPLYHAVVAINDDTLYTSVFLDLTKEPVIVTVPSTADVYSVLHLDGYGNVLQGIPSGQPGIYGLTGPQWTGTLPAGVIPVALPFDNSLLIFRSDKYAVTGQDMRQEAEQFRRNLHAATLSDYLNNAAAGAATILPEVAFAVPFKGIADGMLAHLPVEFLRTLQTAVASPRTQPPSPDEQALADTFNTLFAEPKLRGQLAAGAQAAHGAIVSDYQARTVGSSGWVSFADIGAWDHSSQGYLDRSAVTEFLQYGNDHGAAVYFHAFADSAGAALDGGAHTYVLRFAKDELPAVKRFWSLTAYTPDSIELVANDADKYVVASYTPGLETASDGSVTIVLSAARPRGVAAANWLPLPRGRFNVMLRAYGPLGSVLDGSYVPPALLRTPP
ncbi:MAG: DUF1214 domain-containing protein [Nevskia sp.]|nr:DUF1214 domain-containing protein [Nevskia sp.]